MSDLTAIEWTDVIWNPVTGCDRVSPGCDHCYAVALAPRLKAMGMELAACPCGRGTSRSVVTISRTMGKSAAPARLTASAPVRPAAAV
jgi:protein gp37